MNKTLIILSLVLLTSCGPSQQEKKKVAAVTCSIMGETRNMDAAVRVREMNDARDKIGGEPFLRGDDAIKEALEIGLCRELVLNETYDESLQSLKDDKQEREKIAVEKRAEEQRIADSKPSVSEEFHENGQLKSRINYQSKTDGGEQDGLWEWHHDNGQLLGKGNYKDGNPVDGIVKWFHANGQLNTKANFKDGERDGLVERYYDNGQLEYKRNYKDGNPVDGIVEWFHANGQLDFKECYDNGKEVDISHCEK